MKSFFTISLMALTSWAFADAGWKVIAVTDNCREKVEILAKPGEKYVIADKNGEQEKLFAKDGSAFNPEGMAGNEFKSANITYGHPSMVEANPPKLDLVESGKKTHCRMVSK